MALHVREGYTIQTRRPLGEHNVTMDKGDIYASGHRGIRGRRRHLGCMSIHARRYAYSMPLFAIRSRKMRSSG